MATLPTPGGDDNVWGTMLNTWLEVAHNADGTLQSSAALVPANNLSDVASKPLSASTLGVNLKTVINVKDYPYLATGNGSTDDYAAVQAAITAAQTAGGGTVFFPAGTYALSASLSITASDVVLMGTGFASQLYLRNGVNPAHGVINITGTGVRGCMVKMLSVNGNSANNTYGDGIYIATPWANNTNGLSDTFHTLEDVFIYNCAYNGVEVGISSDTRELKFLRVHVRLVNGHGFYFPWPSQTDGTFDSCVADTCGRSGFYVGGLNNLFTNCKSFYNGNLQGWDCQGFCIIGYANNFVNCQAQDNYQSGFFGPGIVGGSTSDSTYGNSHCQFTGCTADNNGHATGNFGTWTTNDATITSIVSNGTTCTVTATTANALYSGATNFLPGMQIRLAGLTGAAVALNNVPVTLTGTTGTPTGTTFTFASTASFGAYNGGGAGYVLAYGKGFHLVNTLGWEINGGMAFIGAYAYTYVQQYGVSFEGTSYDDHANGLYYYGNAVAPYSDTSSTATQSNAFNQGQQVINVADFGAKGDGSTGSAAGNDAAIAAACLAGSTLLRPVYFPPGTYTLTKPVDLSYNGWHELFGGSTSNGIAAFGPPGASYPNYVYSGATTLLQTTPNMSCIRFGSNTRVRDIQFQSPGQTSVSVTAASASGTTITITASGTYVVGQTVIISTGFSGGTGWSNVSGSQVVTGVGSGTFTIAVSGVSGAPTLTSVTLVGGHAAVELLNVSTGSTFEKVQIKSGAYGINLPQTGRADVAGVSYSSASNFITDPSISAGDNGKTATGTGIPAGSYVGTVTAGSGFLLSSSASVQVNVSPTSSGTAVIVNNQNWGAFSSSFRDLHITAPLNGTTVSFINWSALNTASTGCTWDNIYCQADGNTPPSGTKVYFNNCNEMEFTQLNVEGVTFNQYGGLVTFNNCTGVSIDGLHFERVITPVSGKWQAFLQAFQNAQVNVRNMTIARDCDLSVGTIYGVYGNTSPFHISVDGFDTPGTATVSGYGSFNCWIASSGASVASGNCSIDVRNVTDASGTEFYSSGFGATDITTNATRTPIMRVGSHFYAKWLGAGTYQGTTNTATGVPTTGTWSAGDEVLVSNPVEAGSALSKYIIVGYRCTVAGTPGTWVQERYLTGN